MSSTKKDKIVKE